MLPLSSSPAPVLVMQPALDVRPAHELDRLCTNVLRGLSIDAVQAARSGHPGMPMGIADVAYVLWKHYLKHNPTDPHWIDRDRFVLSAGHGSALLYALLHLSGYALDMDDLRTFRQLDSRTPGHPEYGLTPGVETSTGPLGQGLGNAVGMALAERHLAERFNRPDYTIVDHYTYAVVSDGDIMEGLAHEVASLAGHLALGKLVVLYDSNRITIDGATDLSMSEDVARRFEAYHWQVQTIDGHDHAAIASAIEAARADTQHPSLIICQTHIGFGSPNKQDSAAAHGAPLGPDEVALTRQALGLPVDESFWVPDEVYATMQQARATGTQQQQQWETRLQHYRAAHPDLAALWDQLWSRALPTDWDAILPTFEEATKPLATRAASQQVINALAPHLPGLVSGSADLQSSTMTTIDDADPLQATSPAGRNIYYGVREHGMGALVNGMVLHGGLMPYCSTFLAFSDYMRPAIRMAALMRLPALFIFTHDSIAVGEDGPTHQPVEQLPSLRLIPNLRVLRPADAQETAQAWRMALEHTDGPTALILTRQAVPRLAPRAPHPQYGPLAPVAHARRGGYVLTSPDKPDLILIASGSEVALALESAQILAAQGIGARVVSMPCRELFAAQDRAYRDAVLPPDIPARVAIEAAAASGWERYVGAYGETIGIDTFGASGPYQAVLQRYGLVAERVAAVAVEVLNQAPGRCMACSA